ncbi:metal-dependent hydrolase [Candidatus Woesearchaeota archaeon]|nr:metal-dependent hydrolase [Candidatus Woesearchaeota archaeon]
MLWKTHLAFGFFSGLVMMPFVTTGNIYVYFMLVLFGAVLPDIDNPDSKVGRNIKIIGRIFRHRGIFHSLIAGVLLGWLLWTFVGHQYGIALFVGYASHLFIDGFTKMGINFLHPFSKLHLSGFIKTGTAGEWIVFGMIIFGILYKLGVFGWFA